MFYSKPLKRASAILGIAAVGTVGTVALASPGAGVAPQTFVTSNLLEDGQINHDRIKFQTKDPTKVRVQKLTFAPGSFTGWHHHPGLVVVAIESGFVTHVDAADCSAKIYGPGSPNGSVFIEGSNESHQATSQGGATVYVTYVAPGDVFRVEEPVPSCAQ